MFWHGPETRLRSTHIGAQKAETHTCKKKVAIPGSGWLQNGSKTAKDGSEMLQGDLQTADPKKIRLALDYMVSFKMAPSNGKWTQPSLITTNLH